MPPILVYSVLRLLAFLVPLAVMLLFFPIMSEYWWLTVIFAALIGVSLSVLFLRKPLSGASADLYQRREASARDPAEDGRGRENADAEDAALDADATDAQPPRES